ncbi:MAG: hypothetical protein ACOYXC_18930 [Candidatus Rifleibacteriota bacterium]
MKNKNQLIDCPPTAISRLGEKTFVRMKAWRLMPEKTSIVYFGYGLLKDAKGRTLTHDETELLVNSCLLLTVDPENPNRSNEEVEVFVDRQADPMNMSLNGNQGSGRAFYHGSCFNLKGIGKTVLATSGDPNHSNGRLDLVSALWEAICSNVIATNLQTGSAPVLAVIDTGQQIKVPWRDGLYPGGSIIRIDTDGQLDRPTHAFFRNQPISENEFLKFAANLGRQDGEKFIERILHGCWSAGNVSMNGHFIDYDTVLALRTRAPQWSYRANWLSNFFGLEGDGQKKLLKAMSDHPINRDAVSEKKLWQAFDQERYRQICKRMPDLMGFNNIDEVQSVTNNSNEYFKLVDTFIELSALMHPDFAATAPWHEHNSELAVFDFSRLFRFFPIWLDGHEFNCDEAMKLLKNPALRPGSLAEMTVDVEKHLKQFFCVESSHKKRATTRKARWFVDTLHSMMQKFRCRHPEKWRQLMVKAWVVNEDRTYINCRPGNDFLVALVQLLKADKIDSTAFAKMIQLIIKSCDRVFKPDIQKEHQTDIRIYLNGYTCRLVNKSGSFRHQMHIFSELVSESSETAKWEVNFNEEKYPCETKRQGECLVITGPQLSLSLLADWSKFSDLSFFADGQVFELLPVKRLN